MSRDNKNDSRQQYGSLLSEWSALLSQFFSTQQTIEQEKKALEARRQQEILLKKSAYGKLSRLLSMEKESLVASLKGEPQCGKRDKDYHDLSKLLKTQQKGIDHVSYSINTTTTNVTQKQAERDELKQRLTVMENQLDVFPSNKLDYDALYNQFEKEAANQEIDTITPHQEPLDPFEQFLASLEDEVDVVE